MGLLLGRENHYQMSNTIREQMYMELQGLRVSKTLLETYIAVLEDELGIAGAPEMYEEVDETTGQKVLRPVAIVEKTPEDLAAEARARKTSENMKAYWAARKAKEAAGMGKKVRTAGRGG
jgi:hypothetical protein